MIKLVNIFQKPIDRPIEGVIKADDQRHLRTEVEEYVLTNEVQRQLNDLLDAYNQPAHRITANGVWISGFFGSGKSHLLKMLALLLANEKVDGKAVLDVFVEKAGEDRFLQGAMRKAVSIPSQSILFNIDQKADVISKKSEDALLAVFVKVFNEERGYYGKQGHIANFERDLDRRGLLEDFKQAYQTISGKSWERGREEAILEGRNIDRAYARVTGEDEAHPRDIIKQYRADYRVSIADFAAEVNDYIQARGPDFRLNFFVDEVGQYIAGNVRLMTNLQTIAESLATKCQGRAWIMVTAQEEMDSVIGEMKHSQQGNDFSKIQDRFRFRIKLTSQNVAEVIRKRLLAKNEQGKSLLAEIYDREKNNLGTLFQFPDGGQKYRNFEGEESFIENYPFIPYQFTLFQNAIISFSKHDAFEGKHRSVGERSMLDVFRRVAIELKEYEVGRLATFDMMYEGIRSTVKAHFQRSILNAEQHLQGHPFAVQVLKALFLVKYVKEFRATPGNVAVLMIDRFDVDIQALRQQVEEALTLLERQVYVQRNGDEYEYLTDEEKDIEKEIKNTDIEVRDVIDELSRIVYDQVLRDRKITYPDTGQSYSYSRRLDDHLLGREYELGLHVISPFYESEQVDALLRNNAFNDELLVLMPDNERLVAEMYMYERTEKYVQQNLRSTQRASVQEILQRKRTQNAERLNTIRLMVTEGLAQARLYVGGSELHLSSEDPRTRVVQGLLDLIARTYPNLSMLRGASFSQDMIDEALNEQPSLWSGDEQGMGEAELEVLNFIRNEHSRGLRTTLLAVVNKFTRKPYGWDQAAVQVMAARLIARGKVQALTRGEELLGEELLEALKNSHGFQQVILLPMVTVSAEDLRWLKTFYGDFFNQQPPAAADARTLSGEISQAFRDLANELAALLPKQGEYPFLAALETPLKTIEGLIGKRPDAYLELLQREEEPLFEMKEQVIDPVRTFMKGSRREIYDGARRFLQENRANLDYIDGEEARQLQAILADPACYQGNKMRQAKQLHDSLAAQIQTRLDEEKAAAIAAVQQRLDQLTAMPEFDQLTPEQQESLRRPFAEQRQAIAHLTLIPSIRDAARRFDEIQYNRVLQNLLAWSAPAPDDADADDGVAVIHDRAEIVSRADLAIPFNKPWLENEADVDAYLTALRQALLDAIRSGKRVRI